MSSTPVNSIAPTTHVASLDQHAIRRGVNAAWRRALLLSTITCAAGVALAFSHEYESLFGLAVVAIAVFLGAASVTSGPGFGFVLGFTFGLSCFATGLPWLFNLLDPREAPLAAVLLPTLLIGALSVPTRSSAHALRFGAIGCDTVIAGGTANHRVRLAAPSR